MKYEYDLISLIDRPRDIILDILNTYGKGRWELVSVDNGVAFFKRPIQEQSDTTVLVGSDCPTDYKFEAKE